MESDAISGYIISELRIVVEPLTGVLGLLVGVCVCMHVCAHTSAFIVWGKPHCNRVQNSYYH